MTLGVGLRTAGDIRGYAQPFCKPIRPLSPESRESGDETGRDGAVSDCCLRPNAKPESAVGTGTGARKSRIPVGIGAGSNRRAVAAPVNKQGRVFWTRPLKLPVQDRFGGLADHSRGGPMGVRLTRVVNGDGRKPRFQGCQRGTNTPAPSIGVAGRPPRDPPERYGRRPRSAAAPAGCGQAEKSHADDWLRPDWGVGRARTAGRWCRVSMSHVFAPSPRPPPRSPDA